jgi:hypothetical protein
MRFSQSSLQLKVLARFFKELNKKLCTKKCRAGETNFLRIKYYWQKSGA